MEKNIELRVRDQEKIIKVKAHIENIDIIPKHNFTSKKENIKNIPLKFSPYLRIEIKFNLCLFIDHFEIPMTYNVYLQRNDNYDPFFDDDEFGDFDYQIQYRKYIKSDHHFVDFKDHPASDFIVSFMMLVNSTDISDKNIEREFNNINPETSLLNFNSYKDFNYSICKERIYSNTVQRWYHLKINENSLYSMLPADFKYFLIKDGGMFPHKVQPDLYNLKILKEEEVLKIGSFKEINEIFNSTDKFAELRKSHFERKREEEKKRRKRINKTPFDIRDTIDWSSYNDDLDIDHQDPDFWNQF